MNSRRRIVFGCSAPVKQKTNLTRITSSDALRALRREAGRHVVVQDAALLGVGAVEQSCTAFNKAQYDSRSADYRESWRTADVDDFAGRLHTVATTSSE